MTNLKVSFFILILFTHKCLVIQHTKITLERWWEGGGARGKSFPRKCTPQ